MNKTKHTHRKTFYVRSLLAHKVLLAESWTDFEQCFNVTVFRTSTSDFSPIFLSSCVSVFFRRRDMTSMVWMEYRIIDAKLLRYSNANTNAIDNYVQWIRTKLMLIGYWNIETLNRFSRGFSATVCFQFFIRRTGPRVECHRRSWFQDRMGFVLIVLLENSLWKIHFHNFWVF